jgi:outer membrane protein assembly factor BamD
MTCVFRTVLAALVAALVLTLAGPVASAEDAAEPSAKDEKREREQAKKAEKQAQEEAKKEARREAKAAEDQGKAKKKKKVVDLEARTAAAWYAEALLRYERGKYIDAREILLPLEDSPRAIDLQEKVKLLLADTYFYQRGELNYAEALARYRSFLTFFPTSEHAGYAQFQVGNCYFRQLGPANRDQSHTDNAIAEYQRLIDTYPASPHVGQARRNILEAKGLRARHDFEVGKFYYEWESYEAAALRLSSMLREKPEAPDREEAMYLVAQSLYRLGRRTEGDAFAARLREDYPSSRYASQLRPGNTEAQLRGVVERERKRQKELRRTHENQLHREARSTRQIRKDSGLSPEMPWQATTQVVVDAQPPAAPAAASAAAPPRESPKEAKRREKAEREAAKQAQAMERAEADEQDQLEEGTERELKRRQKQEQEDRKKAEELAANPSAAGKAEKESVKKAEKAAKKAEAERAEQERKEQQEQEEAAAKAAEKAAKDAKKASKNKTKG